MQGFQLANYLKRLALNYKCTIYRPMRGDLRTRSSGMLTSKALFAMLLPNYTYPSLRFPSRPKRAWVRCRSSNSMEFKSPCTRRLFSPVSNLNHRWEEQLPDMDRILFFSGGNLRHR